MRHKPKLSLLFFSLLLCTCSSSKEEKIELQIIGEALPPLESLGELAEEYEKETGVFISINPFEFQTALNKAQLDFESSNPQYDIVMGIFYNLGKYYENEYITPYDEFWKDDQLKRAAVPTDNFYPALRSIVMEYDDKVVGYPFSAQTMFLWFRKDLFGHPTEKLKFLERYGYELPFPDENNLLTWAQYRDLAEFFTRKSGSQLGAETLDAPFYGTTLQLKRHPSSFYELTNFIYSFGGRFFDERGNPDLTRKENIEALNYYLNLREFSPPGVTQFTWDDALAQMQQGRIAMTIMWSDAPSALDDPAQSKVVDKVGYSLVPIKKGVDKKVSVFGGWAFLINSKSQYPEECYKFIQWACSPEFQLNWAKSGGLPGSKTIFQDGDYLQIPYMRAQNEALKNLVSWPRYPGAEEFISKGEIALSRAAIGELSAEQSLHWLSEQLESN